jgi:hypothetical protein
MEQHDPHTDINKVTNPTIPHLHKEPLLPNENVMKTKNPPPNPMAMPGSGGKHNAPTANRYQAQEKIEKKKNHSSKAR